MNYQRREPKMANILNYIAQFNNFSMTCKDIIIKNSYMFCSLNDCATPVIKREDICVNVWDDPKTTLVLKLQVKLPNNKALSIQGTASLLTATNDEIHEWISAGVLAGIVELRQTVYQSHLSKAVDSLKHLSDEDKSLAMSMSLKSPQDILMWKKSRISLQQES